MCVTFIFPWNRHAWEVACPDFQTGSHTRQCKQKKVFVFFRLKFGMFSVTLSFTILCAGTLPISDPPSAEEPSCPGPCILVSMKQVRTHTFSSQINAVFFFLYTEQCMNNNMLGCKLRNRWQCDAREREAGERDSSLSAALKLPSRDEKCSRREVGGRGDICGGKVQSR